MKNPEELSLFIPHELEIAINFAPDKSDIDEHYNKRRT